MPSVPGLMSVSCNDARRGEQDDARPLVEKVQPWSQATRCFDGFTVKGIAACRGRGQGPSPRPRVWVPRDPLPASQQAGSWRGFRPSRANRGFSPVFLSSMSRLLGQAGSPGMPLAHDRSSSRPLAHSSALGNAPLFSLGSDPGAACWPAGILHHCGTQ